MRVVPSEAMPRHPWSGTRPGVRASSPANLHPEVRPLFRAAADHVRMHAVEAMSVDERDRLVECLEAPWGLRIERRLREVFTPDTASGGESTRRIAEVAREPGLQPQRAPESLHPIEMDAIHLVVWMGVVAG
jgi:hypothetical protein